LTVSTSVRQNLACSENVWSCSDRTRPNLV